MQVGWNQVSVSTTPPFVVEERFPMGPEDSEGVHRIKENQGLYAGMRWGLRTKSHWALTGSNHKCGSGPSIVLVVIPVVLSAVVAAVSSATTSMLSFLGPLGVRKGQASEDTRQASQALCTFSALGENSPSPGTFIRLVSPSPKNPMTIHRTPPVHESYLHPK
ncbi:hypothetical protein DFP72DRAFT_592611 [Ephemerocybe angulata]|uniref:Uncharacterized protein n=1 Tax=Ephemerocybe angulata TaxID=980116 RepID=A0A8H6IAK5_9AGAR|nr:hypothetical protein DFP72DRAFT_592611 [Tulosesus angulatus]